jgi:AhpD family alkylhydroperoxidase
MPRLPPAEPRGLDPVRRLSFAAARRTYGRALEPTTIVAHHRPLLLGLGAMSVADERFSRSVDERLKNLARLRAAQVIGCEWCLDFGSYLAQKAGESPDRLRALSNWRDADQFDASERLVLEYAEAVTRTPVEVSDELFGRLRDHFDERQIVELTMIVALENLYSRFNWSLGIEGEGFSEGMYCVRPEAHVQSAMA